MSSIFRYNTSTVSRSPLTRISAPVQQSTELLLAQCRNQYSISVCEMSPCRKRHHWQRRAPSLVSRPECTWYKTTRHASDSDGNISHASNAHENYLDSHTYRMSHRVVYAYCSLQRRCPRLTHWITMLFSHSYSALFRTDSLIICDINSMKNVALRRPCLIHWGSWDIFVLYKKTILRI